MDSVATSQLKNPGFDPRPGILSVRIFTCSPRVSSGFSSFLPLSKNMRVGKSANANLPLVGNDYMVPCDGLESHPGLGFPRIVSRSTRMKSLTMINEWMNERTSNLALPRVPIILEVSVYRVSMVSTSQIWFELKNRINVKIA